MVLLTPIDHRLETICQRIHAIQKMAYQQEAELLGAVYFPPLERTVTDIRESSEEFLGAFDDEDLIGALSIWPDQEGRGVNIASLVVHPNHQRRGAGYGLMTKAVARHCTSEITVQTGARNTPALALYGRFGFKEYRRWFVGREPLELVKLSRAPPRANMTCYTYSR